ncbi:MAG: sugar phosphate nucleotidyltransferase, partial [Deltaproteobacteria bacterium]
DLLRHHREQGAALTVAVHRKTVKLQLGVLDVADDGTVRRYTEKPEMHYEVSMGVYVYEPRARDYIREGEYLDFPDLVKRLIDAGERVSAYRTDAYWLDIGNPDDYAKAQEDAEAGLGPAERSAR